LGSGWRESPVLADFRAESMAVDATVVSGGRHYLVRSPGEQARAFASAARHTRAVRFLRKTLPVFAVLVLASYFITAQLGMSVDIGDLNASIDGVEIADGNLRMINPKLQGADKKNGKYVIGADYADQDVRDPTIIKLNALKADLAAADGGWSRMRAVRGVFNSKTERLVMQDKITVATSSGITGELKHASLNAKTQILRSHRPVSFILPNGTVNASALTFNSGQSILTFRGKVRVHIVRKEKPKEESVKPEPAPAALPPLPDAGEAAGGASPLPMGPQ
jgi:lipopolysaccharide export system protein LptC